MITTTHTQGIARASEAFVMIGNDCVAICETDNAAPSRMAANAKRFALAWNCHDDLVQALKLVEEAASAGRGIGDRELSAILAALSKAGVQVA